MYLEHRARLRKSEDVALCQFSGGADSVAATILMLDRRPCHLVFFDSGQVYVENERKSARRIFKHLQKVFPDSCIDLTELNMCPCGTWFMPLCLSTLLSLKA